MLWEEILTLLERFSQRFSENKEWSIADIGCGNGRLLRHIIDHDMREDFRAHTLSYTGLDSSRVLLSQAQIDTKLQKFSPTWIYGDMRESESLLAPRAPFDACFFIASFHHLENYDERVNVLKQIKKLLQPNGIILMTNWNLTHESQKKYRTSRSTDYPEGSADFHIKIGEHRRFYHAFSQAEYKALARDA